MAIIYSYPFKNIPVGDDTMIISDSSGRRLTKQVELTKLKEFIDTNYTLETKSAGVGTNTADVELIDNNLSVVSTVKVLGGSNITITNQNGQFTITGASTDKTFVFTNNDNNLDVWPITHNLGKYPSVTVVDTALTQIFGKVDFINSNELTVTFSVGFKGKAFLN